MYQVFSLIISIITLAIASSSTLFITGNNKNIEAIKNDSNKLNNQVLANNQLTKNQIISMINKINENDNKILNQHNDIKKNMIKVEKESKSRTNNLDLRQRSFKNITNANTISMKDNININDTAIHKKADDIEKNLNDYKILNQSTINTINAAHSTLNTAHDNTVDNINQFKTATNAKFVDERAYFNGRYDETTELITNKITDVFKASATIDQSSKALLEALSSNISTQLESNRAGYLNADSNIRADIESNKADNDLTFLKKLDLDNEINSKYFTGSVYRNINDLIGQTQINTNDLTTMNTQIKNHDTRITGIANNYLRTSDIPQKINQAMSSTDIHKDVVKNKQDIAKVETKVDTNIKSIEKNNNDLKEMLKGISGGLSGKITLKDLNDSIASNAKKIEGTAAKNKLDILQSVGKDHDEINKKITNNDVKISTKLNNSQTDYNKAFNSFVTTDMIKTKLSDNNIKLKNIDANNTTLSGELIVKGVKFSDIVNKAYAATSTDMSQVASYDKDFNKGVFIEPNKSMKFKEGVNIDMKDTNFNMRYGNMNLDYGNMNLNNTGVSWGYNSQKVDLNSDGANFNDTKMKVNNFNNIVDKDNIALGEYVQSQIDTELISTGKDKFDKYINGARITPQVVTAEYLFIGNDLSKTNVKDEIKDLKTNFANFSKTSGITQNARFYNKTNKTDLFNDIRNDVKGNSDKYLPRNINIEKVTTDSVISDELKVTGNLDKIKVNGSKPIREVLDNIYLKKADAKDKFDKINGSKPIIDIELTSDNVIKYNKNDGSGWTNAGKVKVTGSDGI